VEFSGGGAKPMTGRGLEFSFLRPDGTPAWQLRVEPSGIVVECTRYSRWDRIWVAASNHLRIALEVLSGSEDSDTGVAGAALHFVDRFIDESGDGHYDALFQQTSRLPSAAFSFGDVWHNNSGWFDESVKDYPVLHNLNVIASRAVPPAITVDIVHVQQLRYPVPTTISDFKQNFDTLFSDAMQRLHDNNKAMVLELITDVMAQQIGLLPSMPQGVQAL
jgi:uncharacterized protein (TIGR04255 family)